MKQFIITIIEKQQALKQTEADIAIFKEEIEYIEKHELLSDELKGTINFVENNPNTRFEEAYIERGHKETEEVIAIETFSFLDHSVNYLKEHMEEFIYLESNWLELIGVDAISLEVDDVFRTYDVMLGLKLQKKHEKVIRDYLNEELNGKAEAFDLMFNQNDGMWDLNFTLDYIREFNQDITLSEAYCLIYRVLFKLVETVEEMNDKQL
jgi:hypothetical protein